MERIRDNAYRVFEVCIDSYTGLVPAGRICHPSLEQAVRFTSLMDFLIRMEDLLSDLQMPQSFTAKRSFSAVQRPAGDYSIKRSTGGLATFNVRVVFRQNASWQGTVRWAETGQEDSFRSALELLFLMHSALEAVEEQKAEEKRSAEEES